MNTKNKIICTAAIVMSAAMFFAACDNPWIGGTPGSSGSPVTAALEETIAQAQTLAGLYAVEPAGTLPADVPYGVHYVYQTDVDALNAAIKTAKAALALAATQTAINNAKTALDAAVAVFEQAKQTGTKSVTNAEIDTLISDANTVKAGIAISEDGTDVSAENQWVTQAQMDVLNTAITNLQTAKASGTQQEKNEAYAALIQAIEAFELAKDNGGHIGNDDPITNKAEFEAVIAEAETLAALYEIEAAGTLPETVPFGKHYVFQADVDTLNTAITAAQTAFAEATTQTAINSAKTALDDAITAFESAVRTGTKTVTDTEIDTLISDANTAKAGIAISEDGTDVSAENQWVTQEQMDALNDAITNLQTAKASGTQQERNEAYAALILAIEAFELAKEEGSGKAAGASVSALTATGATITETGITVTAVDAPANGQTVEYAISATNSAPSTGWQDSPAFTGLTAETTYYIFARSKENATFNAGTPSAGLQVATTGVIVVNALLFTPINNNTAYSVAMGTLTDTEIVIPAIHLGKPVTQIADNGFNATTYPAAANMTKITIPSSITSIDVSIHVSTTFAGSGIWNSTPDNSVVYADKWAVGYKGTANGSLDLRDDTVGIGDFAFYSCNGFTGNFIIPNSVTYIGDSAFDGCQGFTGSLAIPNSVISIGNSAFALCIGFTGSLTIPNSVTSIEAGAFRTCGFTGDLTIPASVLTIGNPPSPIINQNLIPAFSSNKFDSFIVDDANPNYKSVDGILYNKTGTMLIQAPGQISGHVIIPSGVTSIGNSAFSYISSLTAVTIPSSVTSIGDSAFINCNYLISVTFLGTIASVNFPQGWTTFHGNLRDVFYATDSVNGTPGTYMWNGLTWEMQIVYALGDTGPAGGIIFYVSESGFTVQGYGSPGDNGYFATYTAHYLEAAPANETTSSNVQWGAQGTFIDGITTWADDSERIAGSAASIGVGRKDTQTIVRSPAFANQTNRAAQRCANKTVTVGGTVFNDWFLPSLGELNEMFKAKGQPGIPTSSGAFWSSSQRTGGNAWSNDFGLQYWTPSAPSKMSECYVRAIRAF